MIFRINDYSIDTDAYEVRRGDEVVPIEPQVFDLLVLLIENRHRLVGKDEIIERIWNGRAVSETALSSRIKSVRQAIGDSGASQALIRTIRSRGFRFVGDISVIGARHGRGDRPLTELRDSGGPVAVESGLPDRATVSSSPLESIDQHLVGDLDLSLPRQPSIAVLPFQVLSSSEADRIFADGLAQDIMTRLGRARWLFVVARGTALTLRGRSYDVREIGRRLGVRYVLQGCVQSQDKRVRLNATLVDVVACVEIWAEYFDRRLDDVFLIQDEIADAVVNRVHAEIEQTERQRALLTPFANLDAWTAYHRGRWHLDRHTPDNYEHAESLFKFASKLDPGSARVLAGLSCVHRQRAFLELTSDREDEVRQAFDLAVQSLSLDPYDPLAHWAVGRALMLRREVQAALQEFAAATELNPSFAIGQYAVGFARTMAGNNALSDEVVARARRLSPYDPMSFAMLAIHAVNALAMGQNDRAADLAQLAAGQPNAHYHIVATAALLNALAGRDVDAQKYVHRLHELCPGYGSADHFRAFPFQAEEHVALFRRGFQLLGLPHTG
jgi:TolB-like protein/DNA-binding winged helix-turn-helix (wHTH) protein